MSDASSSCLRLVGGQRVLDLDRGEAELIGFYREEFPRLTGEVKRLGGLTRYVGYRRRVSERGWLHFLGIEVEAIEAVPAGLVGWELGETAWAVHDGATGRVTREAIGWRWREARPTDGRVVGEFEVEPTDAGEERTFRMVAHAYVQPGAKAEDEVELVEPDAGWGQAFEATAAWLRGTLGPELVRRVEHYGSTAISGIPAKPVVDLLVEVPSFDAARPAVLPAVNAEAWEYWWYHDHMILIGREKLMGRRTHHVHLAPAGHRLWEGVAFRDYLRAHPDEAARYAALKRQLAQAHREDREAYTQAKTEYVRQVTDRALGERSGVS